MNNLTKGSVISLEIMRMGINGEGIGYYNKLAVFVKGAIQKEKIYATVTEVHDKYAVAEIKEIITKSNRRVEPFCKFYETCGACNLQHVKKNEQMKIKRQVLINSLKKYTKSVNVEKLDIAQVTPSPKIAYRNKSQMPFRDTNFGLALGLYQENTNKFVYIDECAIQNSLVNEINKKTLSLLIKYDMHTEKKGGILKYLAVRAFEDSKEAQVTFIVSKFDEKLRDVAKDLMKEFSEVKTVAYSIPEKAAVTLFGSVTEVIEGNNYIHDNCLGLRVSLSPKSFYQLNKEASELVFKEVLDTEIKDTDIVFDGYSGIGVLGLLMSKRAKHVYSVDFNSDSIKNARIIARENDRKNITFYSDRIEVRFPKIKEEGIRPNIVVLDPPRSGLDDKVIKTLLDLKPEKIFYISCNASTLAKNLEQLSSHYDIKWIHPYDFFSETALVESVTVLTLR